MRKEGEEAGNEGRREVRKGGARDRRGGKGMEEEGRKYTPTFKRLPRSLMTVTVTTVS
jgi:hypothetical protein